MTKIRFKVDRRYAYLCDVCGSYWYVWEAINMTTGHLLDENTKEKRIPDSYEYISEEDKDQQEVKDKRERELYEQM